MVGEAAAHSDYPIGCSVIGQPIITPNGHVLRPSKLNWLPKPLHFDDEENTWALEWGDGKAAIEDVALHEIGHLLGLDHGIPGSVMQATMLAPVPRTLQAEDLAGLRALYSPFVFNQISSVHSGKVLDVPAFSTANGTKIQQWDKNDLNNQLWRFS
jgi:hypothetical protein